MTVMRGSLKILEVGPFLLPILLACRDSSA
jgi:hypothetical protein